MPAKETIAIFDIGKTNKKLFLFNTNYEVLMERTEQFAETTDDDGDACEDIHSLRRWMRQSLHDLHRMKGVQLKAVNVAAYGASFVHIDHEGHPVTPLYNYLKNYPADLKECFYSTYGGEDAFSLVTASPSLGSLNSGLQLYRLRYEKPEQFKKIHYSLHLPQYLAYLITGRPCSDITSIGCHTGMWNFAKNQYHEWIYREGIADKLAPVLPSDRLMPVQSDASPLLAGTGLHDSSAALIPYITQFHEPFILISTGTWCISLNPFNQERLTVEELHQDCLCYMEYRGRPVKASRLFAGHLHEQEIKKLARHFRVPEDHYKSVQPDRELMMQLATLLRQTKSAAGEQYHLESFKDFGEAYHHLIYRIILQQVASTNLVMKGPPVKNIYVDGGFGKNPIYMQLLAAAYPQLQVYAASISQATALGAALAVHHYWNPGGQPTGIIDLKRHMPPQA